jgi:hypothetical protein
VQEAQIITYYVYSLIDPRNTQPFYIGKGNGTRAQTHLYNMSGVRNIHKENKINAIRSVGLEPSIIYLVENIEDESLAYDIESLYIKHYGRKGYDPGGILTNICTDSRPPNHKGKTYEEIYGLERAKEQKEKRARLQRERGGYGPKQHSEATKKLIGEKGTGRKYGPCPESRRQKIGEANKKYVGETNKKSFVWKLTSPDGQEYTTIGNIDKLCESLGLPASTIHKMIYSKDNYEPRSGPAKGWKIESFKRLDNSQS